MNRLAVILPIYKRHNLTRLCLEWLDIQSKKFSFDVIVAGSEGDTSKKLVEHFWFKYIEVKNNPLSGKLNALIEMCKDYDGVVLTGSDDFISDSVFELYQSIDVSKPVLYGFNNAHVYCTNSNKLATGIPYGKKMTIGVGRLFTGELLKSLNYKPWNEEKNRGLDTSSSNNVLNNGFEHISLDYSGHFILDVKDDLNITHRSIVSTCEHIENSIRISNELGDIGLSILSLKQVLKIGYMKLVFERDYRPYKSGQVVEFETKDELRSANWFLANGIAKLHCDCDENHEKGEKCSGCEEMAKKANAVETTGDTKQERKQRASKK
jgi:hypothetical protein